MYENLRLKMIDMIIHYEHNTDVVNAWMYDLIEKLRTAPQKSDLSLGVSKPDDKDLKNGVLNP